MCYAVFSKRHKTQPRGEVVIQEPPVGGPTDASTLTLPPTHNVCRANADVLCLLALAGGDEPTHLGTRLGAPPLEVIAQFPHGNNGEPVILEFKEGRHRGNNKGSDPHKSSKL